MYRQASALNYNYSEKKVDGSPSTQEMRRRLQEYQLNVFQTFFLEKPIIWTFPASLEKVLESCATIGSCTKDHSPSRRGGTYRGGGIRDRRREGRRLTGKGDLQLS